MNRVSKIYILCFYTCSQFGAQQKPPVLIHHKKVESPIGTKIKLHNYAPHHIDVSNIPQQVVRVKTGPTKLPIAHHTYSTGIQHLKCVLSTESPQKKSDRKTLEILVRKEPLGKKMAQFLDQKATLKSHEAVVRLYRKVTPAAVMTGKTCWKPVLTIPQSDITKKLLESIKVSPEGKIHLENS